MEKIKVSSAEIVVHGTKDKPYYEIKYRDLSDGQIHEGYSSYNLDYVFEWLEECFEIMPEKDADRMSISEQVKELRNLADYFQRQNRDYYTAPALSEAANTIEALSAKLQAANMERYYNGGWILCEDRLPEEGMKVLVWFEYFRYGEYNRLFQTIGISYTYNGQWSGFVNGSSGWDKLSILAWQPLPEPYHEP